MVFICCCALGKDVAQYLPSALLVIYVLLTGIAIEDIWKNIFCVRGFSSRTLAPLNRFLPVFFSANGLFFRESISNILSSKSSIRVSWDWEKERGTLAECCCSPTRRLLSKTLSKCNQRWIDFQFDVGFFSHFYSSLSIHNVFPSSCFRSQSSAVFFLINKSFLR